MPKIVGRLPVSNSLILALDARGDCIECGDPSAIRYSWWVDSHHVCNCDKCGHDEEDLQRAHYCADCTIELGFAMESSEAAAECGYDPQGLVVLCVSSKVRAFYHDEKWWVLVTELLDYYDSDESPVP